LQLKFRPTRNVSTSLASASSSTAAAVASSDLRQLAVGVGAQQPTSKKRKLFDFVSIPKPSAAEHTVEQNVSRDFQSFLDSGAV